MPPRKSLNNQHYKSLPTLQLNDNDDKPTNFQELLNAQTTWQEAQYRDPYGEFPHSTRNFIETTTRPTISPQQTQHPSNRNLALTWSSQQTQNTSYQNLTPNETSQQTQNTSYQNLTPTWSSQQTQNTSYRNLAPSSSSQQTRKPSYSNFAPNSSSQQFQTQSYPNSKPPFTQQVEPLSPPIVAQSKWKWDNDEDIALCEIGSNVSDRPKQQRLKSFWSTMEIEYNCRMKAQRPNAIYRDAKSCSNRWDRIKKISIGWKAAMTHVRRENRSGQNELDNITQAKIHYNANNPENFKHDHIIPHLENFSKYSWTTTDEEDEK